MIAPAFHSGYFDALLSLNIVQLIGLVVLTVLAFRICQPWFSTDRPKLTYFGFRIALIFSTLCSVILIIAIGVAASESPATNYTGILSILAQVASGVARAILSYALIRLALYPLVEAKRCRHDKGLALAFAILSSLDTVVLVALQCYFEYRFLALERGVPSNQNLELAPYYATRDMNIITCTIYLLIGIVGLGSAIHAFRKSATLDISYAARRGSKIMIALASVWTARALVATILMGLGASIPMEVTLGFGSIIGALVFQAVDTLETLVVYSLLVVCFRAVKEHLPL